MSKGPTIRSLAEYEASWEKMRKSVLHAREKQSRKKKAARVIAKSKSRATKRR
jgi:hypothetical protein